MFHCLDLDWDSIVLFKLTESCINIIVDICYGLVEISLYVCGHEFIKNGGLPITPCVLHRLESVWIFYSVKKSKCTNMLERSKGEVNIEK